MMTLKEQFKFFIIPYHSGIFNLFMHALSGFTHYIAFSEKNVSLILAAFILEEIGHGYDYFCKFDKTNKKRWIEIIPLKIVLCTIFVIVMMWIFNWF
ncbi:MAG: hypothetical protein HN726_02360 [Candidatus Magasanikbacteria bacterium]|jgi:hypothetical protein|nr:hypothetical protein [Candidatus Magasanikbacteria bacterium]MBT4541585.1 hypothetical protein [Candidatus Magasanikbacteria bacterium]MBT6253537.1 hypothetical protein [Candidatus Magasanikbacteria bacterium]MBT7755016.1 hypothetical protein [Candidatus Magasanikbacteria bacterium]